MKVNWKWPNNDKLKVQIWFCVHKPGAGSCLTAGARCGKKDLFFWLLKTKFGFHQRETSKASKRHSTQEFVYNQSALTAAMSEPQIFSEDRFGLCLPPLPLSPRLYPHSFLFLLSCAASKASRTHQLELL